MIRFILVFIFILTFSPTLSRAQTDDCVLPSRLQVGQQARLSNGGLPNNLRDQATTTSSIIDQIQPGSSFNVVAGPLCADEYVWWQVSYAGKTGWTAEGDPTTGVYWLQTIQTPENFVEPEGCLEPPADYTRVQIGYATFNARTLAMLDHAQTLYTAQGGLLNFRDGITQGSYAGGIEAASFGTHDGGGAVDLSVRSRTDFSLMTGEIDLMLHTLRTAGFAAWLRTENELYEGSPIHIHAVAIGDEELSEAARAQIDGEFGYMRGYDGLPRENGIPQLDQSGEMVLCAWMIEQGFTDLRTS